MSATDELENIFVQLNSEHNKISEFLLYFEKINWMIFEDNFPDKLLLEKTFRFIELFIQQFHHMKEEEILFPEAFRIQAEKSGGPKCTVFFQHYLEHKFLEKFQASAKDYQITPHHFVPISQKIIDENSPLSIPLREHETGYYALELLKITWSKIELGEKNYAKDFSRFGRWYIEMLKNHIQKEETCLFVSLKRIFTENQIKELSKKTQDLNKTFMEKTNEASECLAYLKAHCSH